MVFLGLMQRDGNSHRGHENEQRHRGEADREHLIAAIRPHAPLAPASRSCRHRASLVARGHPVHPDTGADCGKVQIKALQGGYALVAEARPDIEKS
jgi:hypothetical protein